METPLKKIRNARDLSQATVAQALSINQAHYCRVENGDTGASPALARKIARYFGNAVTEHQILYPDDYAMPMKVGAEA